jgi:hypothetical protein
MERRKTKFGYVICVSSDDVELKLTTLKEVIKRLLGAIGLKYNEAKSVLIQGVQRCRNSLAENVSLIAFHLSLFITQMVKRRNVKRK